MRLLLSIFISCVVVACYWVMNNSSSVHDSRLMDVCCVYDCRFLLHVGLLMYYRLVDNSLMSYRLNVHNGLRLYYSDGSVYNVIGVDDLVVSQALNEVVRLVLVI
jgi:hypothetical protein